MGKITIITSGRTEETLRVTVCDDETEHLEELRKVFEAVQRMENIQVEYFHSAEEMLEQFKIRKSDKQPGTEVAFCDIVMPEMDGLELGKKFHEILPQVYLIFITAHPEYAIAGYETRAFRYLLKPLTEAAVLKVLKQVREDLEKRVLYRLVVKAPDSEYVVDLKNIRYLSSEDKYTFIHGQEQCFMDSSSLNEYEEELEEYGFCRIHRKYIVNMMHHKSMGKKTIILDDGTELPLSRRREKEYREKLFYGMDKENGS
ncbi:MAG: response regulator transcription factor [Lachnospiraceae bacterium]|nr:response regulator transcription factor [Lachnospiraceae bacterium]